MENILSEDFRKIAESNLSFDEFKDRTFVITGATGLVGSLLVRALLYCNEIHALNLRILAVVRNVEKARTLFGEQDERSLSYIKSDLAADELCIEENFDYVIHAASVTASKVMVTDPVGTILTAVEGTEKVLRLAVDRQAKSVVYISSMEIYGQPKVDGKTAEKDLGYIDIGSVRSCYPEGKRMCECLCSAYASQYNLNVKSARLAQTFGAGILPTEGRVFAQFAKSAVNGSDIVLHTTGESEGNYVYTADAVCGILTILLEGEKGEAYNVANEDSHTTIRNMAEMVAKEVAGGKIQVVIDIPEDSAALGYAPPVKMHLDASKLKGLGWKPQVGLVDSYLRMIRYMDESGKF